MTTRTTPVRVPRRLCTVMAVLAIFLCAGSLSGRSHATSRSNSSWFSVETVGPANAPVLDYARRELESFLTITGHKSKPDNSVWRFRLEVDPSLPPYAFRVTHEKRSANRHLVRLRGADPSCTLDAAYTWLEKMGWRFEITGPVEPARVPWQEVTAPSDETIRPAVNRRGIRQHINFPMDVSSYPLEEAKDYIRNLARMRFNQITFHSYPGQWYNGAIEDGKPTLAGHFFYGEQDVPPMPGLAAHIRNKKVYCIPEIEPVFGDEAKRASAAIAWLQAVMKEAKRVGLTVQFSFEPRSTDTNVESTVALAKYILGTYPEIDCLELMTMEGGGDTPMNEKEIRDMLVRHYGEKALEDPFISAAVHSAPLGLGTAIGQTGHAIRTVRELRKQPWVRKDLRYSIGIYYTVPRRTGVLCRLVRDAAPELEIAVLPQYGARRVAEVLPQLELRPEDFGALTVYSWLEFDGLMFFQQNSVRGLHDGVAWLQSASKDKPATAMLFNHWRTAENRIPARYAALATLYGAQDMDAFYTAYAADAGIGAPETFRAAMLRLEEVDAYGRAHLKNSGFCWSGWWREGFQSKLDVSVFREERKGYEEARDQLRICAKATTTPGGRKLLAFLDNRLRCSILLCEAYESQNDLNASVSKEDAGKICNRTMAIFKQYADTYAEQLPDRGGEGLVVSFYNGPMKGLLKTRQSTAGIPFDAPSSTSQSVDAPPSPIQ